MERGRLPITDPRQDPRWMKALNALQEAMQCQRLGQTDEADRLYAKLLKRKPDYFDALNLYGLFSYQQGRLLKALDLLRKAVRVNPRSINALNNLGVVLSHLHRRHEALDMFERALALDPADVQALNNRGNVLCDLGLVDSALISFESALRIQPNYCNAYINRGRALDRLGRYEEALANYDNALIFVPSDADLHNNRSVLLIKLHRTQEALVSNAKALALKPDYAEAHCNRGMLLSKVQREEEAFAAFGAALALDPTLVDAWCGRADILCNFFKRYDEAHQAYEKAHALAPDRVEISGASFDAKLHLCEWSNFYGEYAQLISAVRNNILAVSPFLLLNMPSTPTDQFEYAKLVSKNYVPASEMAVVTGGRYRQKRIRVAYVSTDFYAHATSDLIAGMIEKHDRSKFEVIAVALGLNVEDDVRRRLKATFDRFVDVSRQSDREVAILMRELEVDIAVDLKGYTQGAMTGIFAMRPAPIQVNYLGYPGTMGADYIDYLIADSIVVPKSQRRFYAEKIVYLPNSYQPNNARRVIADRAFLRSEMGLPEKSFVFCCFNNSFKINPEMFDRWMRILKRVDGAVMWLLEDNIIATSNLRKEAHARGIAPERLVFAKRIPHSAHLARHRLGDLFLDTLPYNAHTTASDALWMGLPILTQVGETFAGRVAASLLTAVGMTDLITSTPQDYEELAFTLATNPVRLAEIRRKLLEARATAPLFDTQLYTRHIEAAYATMYERHQKSLQPDDIYVPQ